jgi:hypothetical protein
MDGTLISARNVATARDAKEVLSGVITNSLSINYQPQNFRILKFVFGSESGAGTAASNYSYPQATAANDADRLKYLSVPSLTFNTNYRFGGSSDHTNKSWNLLGAKINTFTMNASVGDPVNCTLDIPFSNIAGVESLTAPVALPAVGVYYFTNFAGELPNSTAIPNIVDSFEFSVTNNIEMQNGLGSVFSKAAKEMVRDFSLTLNMSKDGTQWMNRLLGHATTMAENPTLIATATITLTKSATQKVVLHFINLRVDNISDTGDYPNIVKENVTLVPELVYVTEQTQA